MYTEYKTIRDAEANAARRPQHHGFAVASIVEVYSRDWHECLDGGPPAAQMGADARAACEAALAAAGYRPAGGGRWAKGEFYATLSVSPLVTGTVFIYAQGVPLAYATGPDGYLSHDDRPGE